MNAMYDNRVFIPVPDFTKTDFTLFQRLVIANSLAKYPVSLWYLDQRTVEKHEQITFSEPYRYSWSFYQPTKDCPLDWRELSVWFILWSIALGTKRHPGKGKTFADWFAGLEILLGLGQREALPLCERLQKKGMLDMEVGISRAKTWFQLEDYGRYAHWFEEAKVDVPMPERFRTRLELIKEEPVDLLPKHETITSVDPWNPENKTKEQLRKEFEERHQQKQVWWNKRDAIVEQNPQIPRWAIVDEESYTRYLSEKPNESNLKQPNDSKHLANPKPEQPADDGDDYLERLKRM